MTALENAARALWDAREALGKHPKPWADGLPSDKADCYTFARAVLMAVRDSEEPSYFTLKIDAILNDERPDPCEGAGPMSAEP